MPVHVILLNTARNRRVLHQPFFPDDPIPPFDPDHPSFPSTSFPFFPDLPSPPPPSSSSSFHANIPSKSNSGSSRLVVVSVALAVSAVVITVIALCLYLYLRRNRRRGEVSDSKTSLSDTDSRHVDASGNVLPMPRVSLHNSSEFLYLGTIVDPRGFRNGGGRVRDSDTYTRNSDSPELRPLPPLGAQSIRKGELDEEDEEFYSPVGSRESSSGDGSASRRPFVPVMINNLTGRKSVSSSSSSYSSSSSSTSDSQLRSVSLSISPQISLSPKRLWPKSPELTAMQKTPPPPPLQEIVVTQSGQSPVRADSTFSIQLFSDRNPRSQSLSSSLSPSNPPPPAPAYPPPPPPGPYVSANSDLLSNLKVPTPLSISPGSESTETTQKPKLKPLLWDKVRARSDREMVWDHLKSSSFKLNEEMIETLFLVKTTTPTSNPRSKGVFSRIQENRVVRVLDPKKAQNIAISLRALNVTIEEVTDALSEGKADTLGTELLECLLKMAPTKEEERKLMEYNEEEDDHSTPKLGQAERFLKQILHVPFAFKRMNAMLYIANFHSEIDYLNYSFQTLEVACGELRTSRMFLKLLQAVLKTGNRMNVGTNRGDAHAFKLDTLLKLVDVKASDGKTTLLHFVVQEMVRTEGARLSLSNVNTIDEAKCRRLGLQVVSNINIELSNVKKAATMDSAILSSDVSKLSKGIDNIVDAIRLNETMTNKESCQSFSDSMSGFVKTAEEEMTKIRAKERIAVSLVKETTEYFHGNSAKEEAHQFRIFVVVGDFLATLDRVCKEIGMINERTPMVPWPEKNPLIVSSK